MCPPIESYQQLAQTNARVLGSSEDLHAATAGEKARLAFSLPSARYAANTHTNKAFLDTIQQQYGSHIANKVQENLLKDVRKPLTGRTIRAVLEFSEKTANDYQSRLKGPGTVAEAFKNVASRLCEKKMNVPGLLSDLVQTARQCRFETTKHESVAEYYQPADTTPPAQEKNARIAQGKTAQITQQVADGAKKLVRELTDEQLTVLHGHLSSCCDSKRANLFSALASAAEIARGGDMTPAGTMAGLDCKGAQTLLEQLKQAVQERCTENNIQPTVVRLAHIDAAKMAKQLIREAEADLSARVDALTQRVATCRSVDDASTVLDALIKLHIDGLGEYPRIEDAVRFQDHLNTRLAASLKSLSNQELCDVFKGTASTGMTRVRLLAANASDSLSSSVLGTLNELESHAWMEMQGRVANELQQKGKAAMGDITASTALILARAIETSRAKDVEIQSSDYLKGADAAHVDVPATAAKNLADNNLTVEQFTNALHGADLTINVNPWIFFGEETKEPVIKNYFEAGVDKGPHYKTRRLFAEQTQLQGVAELDAKNKEVVNSKFHPVSGALNLGRDTAGPAMHYGENKGFVVLKNVVKETRATFTPKDSFHAFHQELTQDKINAMPAVLKKAAASFPEPYKSVQFTDEMLELCKAAFQNSPTKIFGLRGTTLIDNLVPNPGDFIKNNRTTLANNTALTEKQAEGLCSLVTTALVEHFASTAVADNPVATYDNIHQLLDGVDSEVLTAARETLNNPNAINVNAGPYMEAQIHGGVDLRTDISELHIIKADYPTPQERLKENALITKATQFCRTHGVKLILDTNMSRIVKDERELRVHLAPFPAPGKKVNPSFSAFVKHELPDILDKYKPIETTFDPEGIHGREHICRALLIGKVLTNIYKEHGIKVDEYAVHRAIAFHDSGRQTNGQDVYEASSAQNLGVYLDDAGVNPAYSDAAKNLVDNVLQDQQTVEGIILQSADSLDILRTLDPNAYRLDRLSFMGKTAISETGALAPENKLRKQLVKEVKSLINKTTYTKIPPDLYPKKGESVEAFDARKNAALNRLYAYHKAQPSKGYFEQKFEAVLKANAKDLPLLNKYYAME